MYDGRAVCCFHIACHLDRVAGLAVRLNHHKVNAAFAGADNEVTPDDGQRIIAVNGNGRGIGMLSIACGASSCCGLMAKASRGMRPQLPPQDGGSPWYRPPGRFPKIKARGAPGDHALFFAVGHNVGIVVKQSG